MDTEFLITLLMGKSCCINSTCVLQFFPWPRNPKFISSCLWNVDDDDFPAVFGFSSCLAQAGVRQPNAMAWGCAERQRELAGWLQVMASASPGYMCVCVSLGTVCRAVTWGSLGREGCSRSLSVSPR